MFKKSLIIATLVPFLQLFAAQDSIVCSPEKPFLAGDIPVNTPQVVLPIDKFDGKQFTITSWVAPGTTFEQPDSLETGYRGIAFKGFRGRKKVEFSFQLYDFVPNFSFINPEMI